MSTEGKYVAKSGFYIKTGELKAAVQRFKHVIPKKEADDILKRLLVQQINRRLELHGSDGEIYAVSVLNVEPIEDTKIDVGVAVPYKELRDYLEHIPEETTIKCVYSDDEEEVRYILIESEYGQRTFHGIDSCNYLQEPKFSSTNFAIMKVGDFRDMIDQTIFAVDDMPYSKLGGVYFHCLSDKTIFVATNRAILSMYEKADLIFTEPKSVVVPTKVLQAFVAGIKGSSKDEDILIYISDDHILLVNKSFALFSKCLGRDFSDYKKVIPRETPNVATFERDRLYKVVKRLTASVDKKEVPRIEFAFSDDYVELCAPNAQAGVANTEQMICNYVGDALKVSFIAQWLLSILENIKSERIIMRITSSTRPVIIEPKPQDMQFNMLCLIMPLAEK